MSTRKIKISAKVNSDKDKVWEYWTKPEHITRWNSPSKEWHTPKAKNDLTEGGRFTFRMEAKDGSAGFDFGGTYDEIKDKKYISYTLDDDRKVDISFEDKNNEILIIENFEPERENSEEMQRDGWQAILDSFKNYVENN